LPITLQNSPFALSLALARTNSAEEIVAPVVPRPMAEAGTCRPDIAAQASVGDCDANLGRQAFSSAPRTDRDNRQEARKHLLNLLKNVERTMNSSPFISFLLSRSQLNRESGVSCNSLNHLHIRYWRYAILHSPLHKRSGHVSVRYISFFWG